MFPWLVFLKRSGKKLSDIEYLAIKEFDGKLRRADGAINDATVATDLVSITANAGKDMYLASAKVMVRCDNNVILTLLAAELIVNGVTIETVRPYSDTGGGSGAAFLHFPAHKFTTVGIKVAATQIIKIRVTNTTVNFDWNGHLEVFEEDTGSSPAI